MAQTTQPETHYIANASLASGGLYLVGARGDDDPGHVLKDALLTNDGTVVLRYGGSLTGVKGSRWKSLLVGQTVPVEAAEGLVIHNPAASTAGAFSLSALCDDSNQLEWSGWRGRKDDAGSNTRYLTPRLGFTANSVVNTDVTLRKQMRITGLKLEALVAFTGATITLDVTDSKGHRLISALLDLESLVAKTLTSVTLTTQTNLLTLARGERIRFTVSSSDAGDAGGPLAAELAFEDA